MKRALIVTDSLGAPRCEPEIVSYEESWVYSAKCFLEKNGYDVFSITHNGLSSADLLDLANTKLTLYNPEITILQCGIVDCAPRVLKPREVKICCLLKIGRPVHMLAHKYHARLSHWRNLTLYSVEQYEEYISSAFKKLKGNPNNCVIQIPIAPACRGYIRNSPRIAGNINLFNAVLARHSDIFLRGFCELDEHAIEDMFMTDHHHLNARGHGILATIVEDSLSELVNQ